MTALDTNVLVRILVKDDPEQTKRGVQLVRKTERRDERFHVSEIVLCEVVWVLRAVYGFGRKEVAEALLKLVSSRQLVFNAPDRLHRALRAYEAGKGDFADYLIREDARAAGCDALATFDSALLKEELFLSP
ncbi:MAG: type II toxin-antitoxin system VapC family toxin [bacterium]